MAKRLNNLDKDFINQNYQSMTDAKLAEVVGCSVRTIERYRHKNSLHKKNSSKTSSQDIEIATSFSNEADQTEYFRVKLISSPRGRRVKNMIAPNEWPTFIDEWINYHLQLEDLTFTEQNTVEQIILLRFRMDRNQREYRDSAAIRDSLMKENDIQDLKDLDLKDPWQAEVYEKIYTSSIRMSDFNKEYKDLLDKSSKLQETLNATRKQREEGGRVGADTFFALCKKFENKQYREEESRMAELLRMSADKNETGLREAIEYMDGEVAPQLLDSDTVTEMEKNNE